MENLFSIDYLSSPDIPSGTAIVSFHIRTEEAKEIQVGHHFKIVFRGVERFPTIAAKIDLGHGITQIELSYE